MKISLILQAIDRWSEPANKASRATRNLARQGVGPLAQSLGKMSSASDRARGAMGRFWNDSARGERIGLRVGLAMRSMATRGIDVVRRSSLAAVRATGSLLANVSKIALKAAVWGAGGLLGGIVAGGVAGLGLLTRGVIETGSKFEQMQGQLETSLGSVEKAKTAMSWIKKFAQDTPYELEDVTAAFVSAKLQGIDPFNGSMTALGDGASAMGRQFGDAVDAIGDAMNRENERLRAFGIMASVKGAKTTYSYLTKEGKKATKTVTGDAIAMRDAVIAIFSEKFGGGMVRQSQTLHGIWSNMKDIVTLFQLKIADAGFFDHVKNSLKSVYEWSQKIENQAKLDQWAEEISAWLTTLWDKAEKFIKDTDWRSVAQGVGTITTAVVTLVGWLGKASQAYARWKNRDDRRGLVGMLNARKGDISDNQKAWAEYRLVEMDREEGRNRPYRSQERFGVANPTSSAPRRLIAPRWNAPTPPAAKTGDAKISLNIRTSPGVSVRTAGISASGVDIRVNTGKAMSGFA